MQEGSNWEALMFAAHHQLDNLIAIIDYNNLQSLTSVDKTLSIQPLNEKLKSFGWHVIEVSGHNHDALNRCFKDAVLVKNKPTVIIAKTTKGKVVSFMENKVEWHYKSPGTTPNVFMHELSHKSKAASAFIVDVGNHQMWAELFQKTLCSHSMGIFGTGFSRSGKCI